MNVCADEQTESESLTQGKSETQTSVAAKAHPVAARGRSILLAVIVLATAVALGLGLRSFSLQLAPQITAPVSADDAYVASFPERSIAVLPFEQVDEKSHDTSLAEAVQDDILN